MVGKCIVEALYAAAVWGSLQMGKVTFPTCREGALFDLL